MIFIEQSLQIQKQQQLQLNTETKMIDVKNKKNPIAGYMGYIPSQTQQPDDSQPPHIDSHIPGYVGFIPDVKSENLYAKTYGKITENYHKKNYPTGIQFPSDIKYKSTTKDTYIHPNQIKNQQLHEGKISGVKLTTLSNAAKYLVTGSQGFVNNQPITGLTYEQACRKAYN